MVEQFAKVIFLIQGSYVSYFSGCFAVSRMSHVTLNTRFKHVTFLSLLDLFELRVKIVFFQKSRKFLSTLGKIEKKIVVPSLKCLRFEEFLFRIKEIAFR